MKKFILIALAFLTVSLYAKAIDVDCGVLPDNINSGWDLTGNNKPEDSEWDYILKSPVTVSNLEGVSIRNISGRELKILIESDGNTPFTPITIEGGRALYINTDENFTTYPPIIFDGNNAFKIDSISDHSKGRYILNCGEAKDFIQNPYPDRLSQKNVYCKQPVTNFIYSEGYVAIKNTTIQNFHSNGGLVAVQVSPDKPFTQWFETYERKGYIAKFDNVNWYKNRIFDLELLSSDETAQSQGGTCLLIKNAAKSYRETTDPNKYEIRLDNCHFKYNSMGTGAIRSYGHARSNLRMYNCLVENNYGCNTGMVHWNANSNIKDKQPLLFISGCTFFGNQAEQQGAAIFSEGNFKFDNFNPTRIIGNIAGAWDNIDTANIERGGGGIKINGYPATTATEQLSYELPESLEIRDNQAEFGAGILIHYSPRSELPDGTKVSITLKSKLINNKAFGTKYWGGGGIGVINNAPNNIIMNIHLNGATISNNEATNGGGIYVNDSGITFDDSSKTYITRNKAVASIESDTIGNGGGIYLNKGTLTVKNCNITKNSATNNGGGIYSSGSFGSVGRIEYAIGEIKENKSRIGGGIFLGEYSHFAFLNINNFGIYNNIADFAGDEISKRRRSTIKLPEPSRMSLPDVFSDVLWIEDTSNARYRRDHNDEVIEAKLYLSSTELDLALGIVDFRIGIDGEPVSTFNRTEFFNKYENHIAWPFSPEFLQISAYSIEKGTKFSLWRSTKSFDKQTSDIAPHHVGTIIITSDPTENNIIDAKVISNGKETNTQFRIGTLEYSSRKVFLPLEGKDVFYTFTDQFDGESTRNIRLGSNREEYYYRLSYLPATADDETKAKYIDPNIPVRYDDTDCRHTNMVEIDIPRAIMALKHSDYSKEDILSDGENDEWLVPNYAMASVDSNGIETEPSEYRIYKLQEKTNSNKLSFDSAKKVRTIPKAQSDVRLPSVDEGYCILELVYKTADGKENTYGGNLTLLPKLPELSGKATYMNVEDDGLCHTRSEWHLASGGYYPGVYRIWSYKGNMLETNELLHSHTLEVDPDAANRVRVMAEDTPTAGFHPTETYIDGDNTLNAHHVYDHGDEQPYESYRIRHYSVVDPNVPDEAKRYVMAETGAYITTRGDGTVTGVEDVALDNDDLDAEIDSTPVYYNLSGVQIAKPTRKGIYIVRRGNTVTKEFIE